MEKVLIKFLSATVDDCRISPGHLAVFAAIYRHWILNGNPNTMRAFSSQIMPIAKISSNSTYHRLLKELNEYGYLEYQPSFNKTKGSMIILK